MPTQDWIEQTSGVWSVVNEEAVQSNQSSWSLNLVNRERATSYLIEANLKFTQVQDAEDKAGVLAYFEDENNYVLVGLDRSESYGADGWYAHVKVDGVDTLYSGGYNGSVDYSAYHKIRVSKNSGNFDIRIDDMIPPGHTTIVTALDGAGIPGIYTDNAAAAFDGVIYTIGWDEFDSGVTGWGDNANGVAAQGSWVESANGITMSNGTGYAFKGDLMQQYEFSTQVYKEGATDGRMGIFALAIDLDNHVFAAIDTVTNELVVGGVKNGDALSEQRASVANKDDYNIRAVKLMDRVIVFVDGVEKITLNESFAAAQPGLWVQSMSARYNGILVYRTDTDVLPAPWIKTDIGSVGFPGSAYVNDNALYMTGSGADIWGSSDEFSFTHADSGANSELSMRVVNIDHTDHWAKAGPMFRDDLSADSAMAALIVAPSRNGLGRAQMVFRDIAGEAATAITADVEMPFPIWLKLNRQESTFTGYYSSDGQSWKLIASRDVALNDNAKLGLVVTSHNNDRIATAVFDNLLITDVTNTPVAFTANSLLEINAMEGSAYSSTLADDVIDTGSALLSFSLVSGPAWLSVATDGALTGTPTSADLGPNSFTVRVESEQGESHTATLEITVDPDCSAIIALQDTPYEDSLAVLRDFRDDVLKPNAIGRELVAFYYRASPDVAKWLIENENARQVSGVILGGVVEVVDYFYGADPDKQQESFAAEGERKTPFIGDLYGRL